MNIQHILQDTEQTWKKQYNLTTWGKSCYWKQLIFLLVTLELLYDWGITKILKVVIMSSHVPG